ncbi:MAG TPA: type II toxin-antitoxin system PemK/MazF family toxin [Puia sp.]|nr:type II toxin-antitoxin system PemK/MazF family toxin [Puia sp.]
MKRFDIWLIQFDPSKGAEIKKTRPAVIISPDVLNNHLRTVIVAPLTSTIKGYPSRVSTDFDNKGGEIMLDQLRSVDKTRLKKKIGVLDAREAKAVCQLLTILFEQ